MGDADISRYLPQGAQAYTPARTDTAHSYDREREMLFNMIFNLRARIDRLTERLDSSRPADPPLTAAVDVSNTTSRCPVPANLVPGAFTGLDLSDRSDKSDGSDFNEEARAIAEALMRNDGRRKATAAQLGISERTLYRKIREYNLE